MRYFVIVFIIVHSAIRPALAAADDAMGHQKSARYEVSFSANPRFPIAGEEATFAFRVTADDASEAPQVATVEAIKIEGEADHAEDQHGSEQNASEERMEPAGSGGEMASMESEGQAQQELVRVSADPKASGSYLATLTFPESGVYHVAFRIGEENTEFMVGVRSQPIAWWFVYGLGLIIALVAGSVAVIKMVKKEW
jgi:hypothetical protein